MARIAFDLFTKTPDVHVDGARGDEGSFLPHGVKKLIASEDSAAMRCKVFQKTKLANGG
jgi:hypothetical protein